MLGDIPRLVYNVIWTSMQRMTFMRCIDVHVTLYNCHVVASTFMLRCIDIMTLHRRSCDVVQTSCRCIDVHATFYKRHEIVSTLMRCCINVIYLLGSFNCCHCSHIEEWVERIAWKERARANTCGTSYIDPQVPDMYRRKLGFFVGFFYAKYWFSWYEVNCRGKALVAEERTESNVVITCDPTPIKLTQVLIQACRPGKLEYDFPQI